MFGKCGLEKMAQPKKDQKKVRKTIVHLVINYVLCFFVRLDEVEVQTYAFYTF